MAPTTGSITTITNIFTVAQAEQFFPVPYGIGSGPFAGQVFKFAFGGVVTTGTTGTMVITPWYGGAGTSTAVNMGASVAQTYTPSITTQPYTVEGYLAFKTITMAATTSSAYLNGIWIAQGTAATASTGWVQSFGTASTTAISVDTSGLATAHLYGSLNFSITFSVAGTVAVNWTSMQSLN